MRTSRHSFGVLAVAMLLLGFMVPAQAQLDPPAAADLVVLGPDDPYAGATRGEWDARWWQYTVSFPSEEGPAFDAWGEQCGLGQNGPVFFLPDRLIRRPLIYTCVIPAGMAIYVPMATVACSTVQPPPSFGRNEDELRACALTGTNQYAEIDAYIDRRPLPDIDRFATTSPLFTLQLPENNILGVPEGTAHAVSASHGFIIAPPPPGEYEIAMSVKTPQDPITTVVDFWSIRFVVEAPRIDIPNASPMASPMT